MTSYRVVGDKAVLGHKPGAAFTADMSEFDEARLINGGHIEKQAAKKQQGRKPATKTQED